MNKNKNILQITSILLLVLITNSYPLIGQTILVDSGSDWKYLDDGSNQDTSWYAPDFDDSEWKTETAQFGYGDGDEVTQINFGPDSSKPFATTYFRHSFEVDNPSEHLSLTLELMRDDAAVVYLNGEQILISNLSTTHILHYGTLARTPIDGEDENKFNESSYYPSGLIEGRNVIAVEVHQSKYEEAMPDLSFDLRLSSSNQRSVSNIEDLDAISKFRFAIISDNKGDSPYQGNWGNDLERARLSMERMVNWTRSSDFILGLGDHLVRSDRSDPFLTFIKNDPFWKVNFYPNVADGENQAFGTGQNDWGAGKLIFNYVEDFWGRDNVEGQGNGVDYYASFEKNGFKIHVISLHFSDSGPGLIEESRQFMEEKLTQLKESKTDKDIILVLAHSRGGDFIRDANFSSARKALLLSTADLCVSATIHTFERYPDYNIQYPNGAVHYNSGAVSQTGSTHGYMEMHVLENPTRLVIQYINVEDNETRELQNGYIDGIGDPTLAVVKEINGLAYEIDDWGSLKGTLVGKIDLENVPNEFRLGQNYPNPFNPSTTISYSIPEYSKVELGIYNILGQKVAELVNQEMIAGNYEINWNAGDLSSGIYIVAMRANSNYLTKKMTLLK